MTPRIQPALAVDVAMDARREGRIDASARDDADVQFGPGAELPFEDRAVASLDVGAAVASYSSRDLIQLLVECRRVLAPCGTMLLAEAVADPLNASFARWAALVGLKAIAGDAGPRGWTKRRCAGDPKALVSIAIPSSNPRYFLECLDSAIGQTYPHTEIIICDDSADDAIPAMVASRSGHANIRYEKNLQRLRTRLNYEKCLSLARGEYVKFLNDDDMLEPDCVRRMVRAFQQVPDLILATSHRHRIDGKSRVIEDMPATRPVVARDLIVDGISLANAAVMYGLNFIGEPSTAMFRKSDFDRRPAIDGERPFHFNGEEVRGAVDFAMWTRLLVQGNAVFLSDRLSRFRVHPEQAQARPDVVARSIAGIRALQHQWVELGLFKCLPPHLLRVQSLPPGDGEEWRLEPVLSLPQPVLAPEESAHAWRNTARHSFDFT